MGMIPAEMTAIDCSTPGGPEALVGDEVAANLAEAIGRPVRFQSLAPEEFAARVIRPAEWLLPR